jgi:hypothetical protein
MLPGFAEIAITVIDPGWKTVNGSKVADWDNPTRTETYEYCWATPGATEEDLSASDADKDTYFVMFPEDAIVPHTSKVVLANGGEYQVIGRPKRVPSITGNLNYVTAYVERWTG